MAATDLAAATRHVLLAVRLRASAEVLELRATLASMGIVVDDLETLLGRLELAGLVEARPHAPTKWRLTADGRDEGERLLAVELDERGIRGPVMDAYERFLSHNGALLRVCTDWQLRDADPSSLVINDHSDPVFDRVVIARLGTVYDAVVPICDDLAVQLSRFSGYRPRFSTAIGRVRAGDHDAVDGASTDSYHAIWFELHEHLLATVGRDRSTEPVPDTTVPPPAG